MRTVSLGLVSLSLASLLGCAQSPTTPQERVTTGISFAGRPQQSLTSVATSRAITDTLRIGHDVLVVERADLVLQQVRIAAGTDGCAAPADARCAPVVDAPTRVAVPLGGYPEQRFAVEVPSGAYALVALDIVPSDALDGHSVRIAGSFNGRPFVFVSRVALARALVLPKPLVIGWTGIATNVTVRLPVASWFRGADGRLINPELMDEARFRQQLVASLQAFEDRDRDGDDRNG